MAVEDMDQFSNAHANSGGHSQIQEEVKGDMERYYSELLQHYAAKCAEDSKDTSSAAKTAEDKKDTSSASSSCKRKHED